LLAASHAGCFAMALSLILGEAGYIPDSLDVTAEVTMDPSQLAITQSHLKLHAKIANITKDKFWNAPMQLKTIVRLAKP
jgi:osmotically inducible protein OsmC